VKSTKALNKKMYKIKEKVATGKPASKEAVHKTVHYQIRKIMQNPENDDFPDTHETDQKIESFCFRVLQKCIDLDHYSVPLPQSKTALFALMSIQKSKYPRFFKPQSR